MQRPWYVGALVLLTLWLPSGTVWAMSYDFSGAVGGGNYPACVDANNSKKAGSWSVSGSAYTCSDSIALNSGDSIASLSSISVVANSGMVLAGNNTIGSSGALVDLATTYGRLSAVNGVTVYGKLTSASGGISLASASVTGNIVSGSGDISVSNGSITGSITASSGAVTLSGIALTGSITTSGKVSLTGGSVSGDVTGQNGVTTTSGTVIGGRIVANNGSISLSGGSVAGSVHSDCCSISTNSTDIGSGVSSLAVSSNSSTISVTGGTILGNISTSGGQGIIIKSATISSGSIKATGVQVSISDSTVSGDISSTGGSGVTITNTKVTAGSITATTVPISISNSTIGSSSSRVNIVGQNQDSLFNNTTVYGDVTAGKWNSALDIDNTSRVYGVCSPDHLRCHVAPVGVDHVRVFFNNNASALTCSQRLVDAIACADSTCSTRYASDVSVSLSPGGAAATIPASGTGTPSVATTTVGAATLTLAASTPAVVGATPLICYSGTVASPGNAVACTLTFSAAGLFVSVPNHFSGVAQTLTITAAKTDNKTKTCVPAFDSGVSRDIKLRFAYNNPGTGTLVPTVGSASPPTGKLATASDITLAMAFTAGVATTNFLYADAGSLTVSASYLGSAATSDAGLNMTTVANPAFVVVPANFLISGIPAAPLIAGKPFNVTVTAKNSSGDTTANFGAETTPATALLTSSNPLPALGNATAISQAPSAFKNGVASTDLTWDEVGTIDITATTTKYLDSALNVVGSQAAVGRFKPAYFDTVVTPSCSSAFTYAGLSTPSLAGQPFAVEVKAKRSGGNSSDSTNTANYAGATWARVVTLSDAASGSGTLANNSFAAAAFFAGKAKRADVSYVMAAKLTQPYALTIRATDADSPAVSSGETVPPSKGSTEGRTLMRSGRLRLANAFGSEKADLKMPVQAQYWSGQSWVLNSDDSCTSLPASAFALYPSGVATSVSAVALSGGKADLTLTKPNPVTTGYADVAANLGASGGGNDLSCLASATKPVSTPAVLSWLRAQNGNCATTYDRDPSARASFGVYSAETKKTVHIREAF